MSRHAKGYMGYMGRCVRGRMHGCVNGRVSRCVSGCAGRFADCRMNTVDKDFRTCADPASPGWKEMAYGAYGNA